MVVSAILLGVLVAGVVAAGLMLVPRGAHRGGRPDRAGAGLGVLPWEPGPRESMQLEDDRAAWEPHRFAGAESFPDVTAECWQEQPGLAPGLEQFRAGAYHRPLVSDGGLVSSLPPSDVTGPGLSVGYREPRPGHPLDPGAAVNLGDRRCEPLSAAVPVPEVAHEEEYRDAGPVVAIPRWSPTAGPVPPNDAGPAGGARPLPSEAGSVSVTGQAAGPVPHTEDDLAMAADVQAYMSAQDADVLNYCHDLGRRAA